MIATALTSRFGLTTPVIGAPMAGVAGGALAAGVSSAGGLGMIGIGSAATVEFLARQCAVPRERGLPFGVGLMAWALPERPDLLDATIAARPALVSVSFGDPAPYVGPLHAAGIAVAAQVNTVADVHTAQEAGVDLLVAQGSEAGGHTGSRATLPLLQEVLAVADRPVVAAGGIATGRGMAAALAAGAAGVWIGTALLACPEALNTPRARATVRAAAGEETVLTRTFDVALGLAWPERWRGRALVNDATRTWHGRIEALAADPDARARVVEAQRTDDLDHAPLYAGEAVGLVTDERPASDVVRDLTVEAEQALRRVSELLDQTPTAVPGLSRR